MFLFPICLFFFFNDTATTEIYTLSLHDALPICQQMKDRGDSPEVLGDIYGDLINAADRKSTRLNSSHLGISYAVFCLKKKKKKKKNKKNEIKITERQDHNKRHTMTQAMCET